MKKCLLILASLLTWIVTMGQASNYIWNKTEATTMGVNDLFWYSQNDTVKKLKFSTLRANTTVGDQAYPWNVKAGYQAGNSLTTGRSNTLVGTSAGKASITGNYNVMIGDSSGFLGTNQLYNTLIGAMAGYTSNNYYNIAIGYTAGYSNNGQHNAFIGSFSGNGNTGSYNTMIGHNSGRSSGSGGSNVFIGYQTGYYSTGSYNAFLGYNAGVLNSTGFSNTFAGTSAGYSTTTGYQNTFIGDSAGYAITTGRNNVFLGYKAGVAVNQNNKLKIGADSLIEGDFAGDSVTLNVVKTIITGDLSYSVRHAYAYFEAGTYTPNVTQNVYFKMAPGFTTAEASAITVAGDSITIITPGDYTVTYGFTFSGSNTDDYRIKIYKNGVAIPSSPHVTTTGAANYQTIKWHNYIDGLVAGDDLSFRVVNTSSNNDPTFTDGNFFIRKEHD